MVTCRRGGRGRKSAGQKPEQAEAGVNECILYVRVRGETGTCPCTGPLAGGARVRRSRPASGYPAIRVHNTYLLTYTPRLIREE